MDRKQYGYFLELLKQGSVSRAAQSLYLTRQALSKSMQSLEAELGEKLFVRGTSGIQVTEFGQHFAKYAQQENSLWEQLKEKAEQVHLSSFRLGTHMFHANEETYRLEDLYASSGHTEHIIFVDSEECSVFWEKLLNKELDAVMTRKAPVDSELAFVEVATIDISLLVSKKSKLARASEIDFFKDLQGQTYLSTSKDTLDEMKPYLEQAGMEGEYIPAHSRLLKSIIEKEKGIFFLPDSAKYLTEESALALVSVRNFPLEVGSYVVYRADASKQVLSFVDFLVGYQKGKIKQLKDGIVL